MINPAGFLHAGFALRDCLRSFKPPVVEVHMSNIDKRGLHSVTAEAARGIVAGFGIRSYLLGLDAVAELVRDEQAAAKRAQLINAACASGDSMVRDARHCRSPSSS